MTQISLNIINADLFPGEKVYPIYRVRIDWSEDYPPGAEQRMHRVGQPPLPEGRFWNGTGWDTMEKVERPVEEIVAELTAEWWPKYKITKNLLNPSDVKVTVELKWYDTWCDDWFSHHTFDVGLSDKDVLESFSRYVDRLENARWQGIITENEMGGRLMSAEDRWRWTGSRDGSPETRTDPPCRCEHCKKQGIVRIGH